MKLLCGMLNAWLKDLSISRTVEGETEPFASRPPVVECWSSFNVEQVIGDGTI